MSEIHSFSAFPISVLPLSACMFYKICNLGVIVIQGLMNIVDSREKHFTKQETLHSSLHDSLKILIIIMSGLSQFFNKTKASTHTHIITYH